MSKIAILTDTNSGITRAQAKELGIHLLSMPFTIDDINYLEDINLTQEQFFEFLEKKSSIKTSQPSPADVSDSYARLLRDHDEVIHIPMSSGLSGSCQTAYMLSQEPEFEGRVFVIDNQRISVPMRQSIMDAIRLREQGLTASEISEKLMADKFNTSIYIMLDTLYYLKKGGRITPAAAAIGTLLKIKPVLTIQGEKLDAFSKARTTQQGRHMMIEAIKKDIDTRFGGMNDEAKERIMLAVAYTKDRDRAEQFKAEIMEAFPGFGEPYLDPLPLSIACHTGPGALGMACTQKIEYLK